MKKFSKALALCLAAVLLAGLFTACGKSYNFTSADAVDSSDSQQRWLKYPDSSIVINPAAVDGEDSTDRTKQALSIGIGDKTVDDVLFTLEDASSIRSIALSGKNLSVIYLSESFTAQAIASSVIITP